MLVALASVTDSLVTFATHVIRDLGLGGVSMLTISSAVIGVPGTEPTMLFAGFNVFQGHLTLLGIVVFGLLGDVVGAAIAYAIGYFGRQELFERQGGKLHMGPERLERAHRWFARYGAPAVVLSRLVPVVRAAFPYAAGVAEMPFGRFIALSTLGSIPWITGLGVLGREVGSSWQSWRR
ncbi:MAG: DedA family protein, partial [Actinomycetota bacterium]|nr:DedA family protein [Actinomycetota bacterium]